MYQKTPKILNAGSLFYKSYNKAKHNWVINMVASQKIEIKWRGWNEESFREAKKEGKLLLLYLFASWDHWCQVMDETTYSDSSIVDDINLKFIPIKVNIDKRPDIGERYNFGGFPTNVFITPEGEVLTGATYIKPEKFGSLLDKVLEFYEKEKESIKQKTSQLQKIRAEAETASIEFGELSESIVQDVVDIVIDNFDSIFGGFGVQPKFPVSEALEFALSQYYLKKDDVLFYVVKKTLDEMQSRNIYDKIDGGFFRYSEHQDWSNPHYEKMLQVNAQLLINYLHAYQITGKEEYAQTAKEIIRYVDSPLSDKNNGGFYGSQASDKKYYKLRKIERINAIPPPVDKSIYTDRNAIMISAYLEAYVILKIDECREFAMKTIEFIIKNLYRKETGLYHYIDKKSKKHGLLTDNLYFSKALIDAYQTLGEKAYLSLAEEVANFILDNFVDMKTGRVFDIITEINAVGLLKNRSNTITQNALAADLFNTLYNFTDKNIYHVIAEVTLNAYAKTYNSQGLYATLYAQTVDRFLNPPVKITVIGPKSDKKTHDLHIKTLSMFEPRKIVEILDPKEDEEKIRKLNFPKITEPTAYARIENKCSPPIYEPDEVIPILKDFLIR